MTVLFSTEQAPLGICLTKRMLQENGWMRIEKCWALTTNVGFLQELTLHVTNRFLLALHEELNYLKSVLFVSKLGLENCFPCVKYWD